MLLGIVSRINVSPLHCFCLRGNLGHFGAIPEKFIFNDFSPYMLYRLPIPTQTQLIPNNMFVGVWYSHIKDIWVWFMVSK